MSREQVTKEIYISSTPHETRLAITENDSVVEVHYERENEYTLAGAIYNGKVTRVLPGMQSAFVDVGLERDAFLYVTDFLDEQEDSGEYDRQPIASSKRKPQEKEPSAGIEIDASAASAVESGGRRGRRRRGRSRGATPAEGDTALTDGMEVTVESADHFGGEVETVAVETTGPEDAPESSQREARRERWRERRNQRARGGDNAPFYEEPASREHETAPRAAGNAPVLLPGESLRKYKGGDDRNASSAEKKVPAAKPAPKFRPTTEVTAPITWDGSSDVLPGETLRRKRKQKADEAEHHQPDAATNAARSEQQTLEAQHSAASATHEAEVSHETLEHFDFAASAASEEQQELAPAKSPDLGEFGKEAEPQSAASEMHGGEAHAPSAEAADHLEVAVQEFADDEAVSEAANEIEDESELTQGSASHRVDPNPPSEFRSWFGRKKDQRAEEPEPTEAELAAARHELAHEVAHRLAHQPGMQEEEFPSLPEFVQEEEHGDEHAHGALEHAALGSGQIEEELIEEDEYEFEPLQHDSDEPELENMTEETLDGNGDFGDYLRDSQVTHAVESDDEDAAGDSDEGDGETIVLGDDTGEETDGEQTRRRRRGDRRGTRGRHATEPGRRSAIPQRRRSAQLSDLPVISELLKPGQEILVQIAKEPIAKKGARITSHIALPGRFLVFMPTVEHVGVSRKIASDEERQRLKRILLSEKGDAAGGFIVRTAAGSASEQDLRADIRFLINLWNEIKQRSEGAKSPALIYHDLNLVERVLRDQVTDKFSAIWVDTEQEYERVVKFLSRFQPALVRHVKLYTKETPLFEQFGIQDEINKALKSKVWLKSGGSIVINQTEALVAIDINTGKYVGKTARLEDTILKTNLDSIPEIVRQIRLRDLGGIIVIDFIDMDDRRNRHKVMAALEEELKNDRAPSKVLQFNDFGLVAITRKRVKQSLERTLSMPCTTCEGTGMVKNPTTVCNEIYIELRKMHRHLERRDVMLRVHPEVVKQLKSQGSKWLQEMEELAGKTILVKSDPSLTPDAFDIH